MGHGPGFPELVIVPGVGIDIIAVGRITAMMQDRGMAFLERWFPAREIDYCSSNAAAELLYPWITRSPDRVPAFARSAGVGQRRDDAVRLLELSDAGGPIYFNEICRGLRWQVHRVGSARGDGFG